MESLFWSKLYNMTVTLLDLFAKNMPGIRQCGIWGVVLDETHWLNQEVLCRVAAVGVSTVFALVVCASAFLFCLEICKRSSAMSQCLCSGVQSHQAVLELFLALLLWVWFLVASQVEELSCQTVQWTSHVSSSLGIWQLTYPCGNWQTFSVCFQTLLHPNLWFK